MIPQECGSFISPKKEGVHGNAQHRALRSTPGIRCVFMSGTNGRSLRRLGAQLDDKSWAMGVDLYRLRIGDQELSVFSDAWSLDIEGPDDLVQRVLREYAHNAA